MYKTAMLGCGGRAVHTQMPIASSKAGNSLQSAI